jgi:hypothetical protein
MLPHNKTAREYESKNRSAHDTYLSHVSYKTREHNRGECTLTKCVPASSLPALPHTHPAPACFATHTPCPVSQCACRDLASSIRVGPPLFFVVRDLNVSVSSPDVASVCAISGCAPNSLLNQVDLRVCACVSLVHTHTLI